MIAKCGRFIEHVSRSFAVELVVEVDVMEAFECLQLLKAFGFIIK